MGSAERAGRRCRGCPLDPTARAASISRPRPCRPGPVPPVMLLHPSRYSASNYQRGTSSGRYHSAPCLASPPLAFQYPSPSRGIQPRYCHVNAARHRVSNKKPEYSDWPAAGTLSSRSRGPLSSDTCIGVRSSGAFAPLRPPRVHLDCDHAAHWPKPARLPVASAAAASPTRIEAMNLVWEEQVVETSHRCHRGSRRSGRGK